MKTFTDADSAQQCISRSGKVSLSAYQQSALALQDGLVEPVRKVRAGVTTGLLRRPLKPIDGKLLQALRKPSDVVFLDIETTGLSHYYDEITVVGWLQGGIYRAYVAGDDPAELHAAIGQAGVIVTFNGTLFDLRFLRRTFPDIRLPLLHADLRYLARRIGLTGGQKAIERTLNVLVREGLEDVDGAEAVLLWHRYLRGSIDALQRLIEYNHRDVLGMCHLLDVVLDQLDVEPELWAEKTRFAHQPVSRAGWARSGEVLPCASRLNRTKSTFVGLFAGTPAETARVVGIDLTGSEVRPSGWCLLSSNMAETATVSTDQEIMDRVLAVKPDLVSIDSPLSLPFGRTRVTDDDPARVTHGIMRQCERELKRRGINVYPCLLPSMQRLTERGIRLASRLRKLGIPVIESYPGAAQDIMGIPRKGAGVSLLRQGLEDFGVVGEYLSGAVTHDELDSITSALVGSFLLASKFEALSGNDEDPLIIPDLKARAGPPIIGLSGKIAAGKTTVARILEKEGFAYTRFSLVVDDEIRSRGQVPNRMTRQAVGLEIHNTSGQRWLAAKALERVDVSGPVVIDGLRFLEDHAYLVERFASRFVHVHITASDELRSDRYRRAYGAGFDQAESAPVERQIPELKCVAHSVLGNSLGISDLACAVARTLDLLTGAIQPERP